MKFMKEGIKNLGKKLNCDGENDGQLETVVVDIRHSVIVVLGFLIIILILTIIGLLMISIYYALSFHPPVTPDYPDWEQEEFWNDRPIIGILAQELPGNAGQPTTSYIAASYIKFIEGGGGRVAPILINQTEEYYKKIFKGINGILFPGGGARFGESGGYGAAGKILLSLTREANDRGDFFPIWATCLGFEFLVYDAVGRRNVLEKCNANNITSKLQFTKDAASSRMFGGASSRILRLLSNQSLTANFHSWCLTLPVITKHQLDSSYKFLSWSVDEGEGTSFVSSMEHRNYPIYGVQFHPEKNIYEWSRVKAIPHSKQGILVGQYFAQFFINEARKSRHSFGLDEEVKYLIYNWNVTYTGGIHGTGSFQQSYFFPI